MVEIDLSLLGKYIQLEHVFLFGSAVNRERLSDASDIDILVVSDSFKNMSLLKRKEIVLRCIELPNLDPICMTKIQFENMNATPSEFSLTILDTLIELQ